MSSGQTLATILPMQFEPVAVNGASPVKRNGQWLLAFNNTTNQSAIFPLILPRNYSGGGLTVYIHFVMASAITGDVDLDVAFERQGEVLDIDADSFAVVQSIDNTVVPGTAGIPKIVSIPFTNGAQIDSIAVGEKFRLRVTRDAVSDTATGDLQIIAIEIKET